MIVDELIAILGFDVRGEGELRKFNQGLDGAERKARSFSSAMLAIGGAAVAALGGLAIGRQVGDFVGSIATVNAEFETYEATLKTITGSAEEASRAMDWITDFGRTTPYEASQVTEAFVRLKSYGIDPMDGSLRTVGDAASAMGKSLMSGVEAIADAVTGENERLKEFGVRASAEGKNITYTWTENGRVLTKTVKKDAVEIQTALMGIFSRFNGAMDEQSKTWVGMTSNLADNWTEFLREIGGAGYYDDIKRRLQGVLDFADRAFESGLAGDVAKGISDALIGTIDTVSHLATQAYRIGRAFYYAADGVVSLADRVNGLGKAMNAAGLGLGLIASSAMGRKAMMAIARRVPQVAALLVLDDIISGLNGDDSAIGRTEKGAEALEKVKAKFAEFRTALDELGASIQRFREITVQSFGFPPDAFSSFDDIRDRWHALRDSFSEPIVVAGIELGSLTGAFDAVEGWADSAARRIRMLFTDPVGLVMDLIADALDRVATAFDMVASALKMLASPIESIKSALEEVLATARAIVDAVLPGADAKAQDNPNAGQIIIGSEIEQDGPGAPATDRPRAITATAELNNGPFLQSVAEAGAAVGRLQAEAASVSLSRDALMIQEGLRVEHGVSEADSSAMASTIGGIMRNVADSGWVETIKGLVGQAKGALESLAASPVTAEAVLNIDGFMGSAGQAQAAATSLGRTYTATIDANTAPLMQKLNQAEQRLAAFQRNVNGASGAVGGRSAGATPSRIRSGAAAP